MIGIDTNIIVRLLVNDDKKQARVAANIIEKNATFIPKSVLLEAEWVLRYTYELKYQVIHHAFEKLLGLPRLNVEDPDCVTKALEWYSLGFDFADALHLASCQDVEAFATFDKKFIKQGKKFHIKFVATSASA